MTNILQCYNRIDITFEQGDGAYLFASNGKKYLDFTAGIATNSLGHNHPSLVQALQNQAGKLWHVSNLYHIDKMESVAGRLAEQAGLDKVFFCNSGAEAGEASIKMARKYHNDRGTGRTEIICFNGAFHGRTIATISAAGRANMAAGFEPLLPDFVQIEAEIEAVRKAINPHTAAIMLEPIQGEGGINLLSNEFLQAVREICDANDILLIADEVQSGAMRTGKFFAYQWAGIQADIIMCAKGLGGGFPVGAVICSEAVAEHMGAGTHGSTYGGNPLAMAVVDAVLAELAKVDVVAISEYLWAELEAISDGRFAIKGRGLLVGLELSGDIDKMEFIANAREAGLLLVAAAGNIVRLLPPLNIGRDEVDEAMRIIKRCL